MNNEQSVQQTPCKTPFEELKQKALEHYNDVASKASHWNSFVEHAIKAYQDPESTPPHRQISNDG